MEGPHTDSVTLKSFAVLSYEWVVEGLDKRPRKVTVVRKGLPNKNVLH